MNIFPTLNIFTKFEEKIVYRFKNNKLIKNIEVIDKNSLERYRKLSMFEIARKTLFIFCANPIVLIFKMSFNVVQMGFDFIKVNVDSTIDMARDLSQNKIIKMCETYLISRIDLVKYLIEDIICIVRAPFYALALQLACPFSLLFPNQTRRVIAKIEKSWNYNMNVRFDFKKTKEVTKKSLWQSVIDILYYKKQYIAFYIAPCFQPIGSLKDKNVRSFKNVTN
ncbi:MAG: hypothetical protein K940chlam1_00647 [Candidatus Anoxychlamydiales bacterium]|nr:hypothetical protein [Candidatus Anoxychlamydiales bacterium]NGX36163.1 hypothetical protein [Candidatus Anoxychlamydiales bacterium]